MADQPTPGDYALARSARTQAYSGSPHSAQPARAPEVPGYDFVCVRHFGGQGVVYQAVQLSTGRDVAIKFLRAGLIASPREQARMEREIQILAQLRHPNIVTIYDSGVTEDGLSYIVMDFIDGEPLDAFVEGMAPSVEESLRLFVDIVNGVQYAHLHGVVHRDLKPSNILVDGNARPHVVDFGLAKLSTPVAEQSLTNAGQIIGSLPWSAPEQVQGRSSDIDVRTDVYGLGAVLYQLLARRLPYRLSHDISELVDQVLRHEPAPPSVFRREINDEIDTIVLKCLQKDSARRYQSAGQLARDIERYLRGDAIDAKRDSKWYVLKKAIGRHRIWFAVVAVFVVLVVAASSVSIAQWRRAERELARATQVKKVLFTIFEGVDPAVASGEDTALLRSLMETAEEEIAPEMDGLVEADVRNVLGMVYSSIDDVSRADSNYRRALRLRRTLLGDEHEKTLDSLHHLAKLRYYEGRYEEARTLFEEALDGTRRVLGPGHEYTYNAMNDLAVTLKDLGEWDAALPLQWEALEGYRRVLGDDHPHTLATALGMGALLRQMGRAEEAEPYYREALAGLRRTLGDQHPDTQVCINNMGALMRSLGDLEKAEAFYREAMDLRIETLGPEHSHTLISLNNLAGVLLDLDRSEEAGQLLERHLFVARARWEGSGPLGLYLTKLGRVQARQGEFEQAETTFSEAYELLSRAYGDDHRHTRKVVTAFVELYEAWDESVDAGSYQAQAAEWRARLDAFGS